MEKKPIAIAFAKSIAYYTFKMHQSVHLLCSGPKDSG